MFTNNNNVWSIPTKNVHSKSRPIIIKNKVLIIVFYVIYYVRQRDLSRYIEWRHQYLHFGWEKMRDKIYFRGGKGENALEARRKIGAIWAENALKYAVFKLKLRFKSMKMIGMESHMPAMENWSWSF